MNNNNETFTISANLKNGNTHRTHLSIKRNGIKTSPPDVMVVMMNPGSAKNSAEEKEGENPMNADATLRKIQVVMNHCNYNHARVINLSDLRKPRSQSFYDLIKVHRINNNLDELLQTSIFHSSRKNDFRKIFVPHVPVIIAWGIEPILNDFIQLAAATLKSCTEIYGLQKIGTNAFYHPLRRPKTKPAQFNKWDQDISE